MTETGVPLSLAPVPFLLSTWPSHLESTLDALLFSDEVGERPIQPTAKPAPHSERHVLAFKEKDLCSHSLTMTL